MIMTWCNDSNDVVQTVEKNNSASSSPRNSTTAAGKAKSCPSCGHQIKCQPQVNLVNFFYFFCYVVYMRIHEILCTTLPWICDNLFLLSYWNLFNIYIIISVHCLHLAFGGMDLGNRCCLGLGRLGRIIFGLVRYGLVWFQVISHSIWIKYLDCVLLGSKLWRLIYFV